MANKKKSAAEKRKKDLTPLQDKFAKELVSGNHPTRAEAAIAAGYSDKNPQQSAYQALQGIKLKVPELMDDEGLSVKSLIHNHLLPKLKAKETKFFHNNGKILTRQVEALGTQMQALDMSFQLHGAYAPKDADLAAQVGVKVIVVDIPRPVRGVVVPDVLAPIQGPDQRPSRDQVRKTPHPNGHKNDTDISR